MTQTDRTRPETPERRHFIGWHSFSLWMLPLPLMLVYTFFRYGTLNVDRNELFHPLEGSYIVYIGWFIIGLAINIGSYARQRGR
ncbi:hypothetical protein QWJ34_17890 [Saccharibacillus sp. CPCC 101409]|uniref:hypothetical protein n=1 Tax=Saccharibacillus sp. CPCC 101409 TaxID=3058041 RepID=UPI0026735E79|nr:hypothetical protein [Saccharibacillus sp. CPCC 101409]MDO3411639.1 hypothetical protein [Saccharibacillus sp. CPCC 101409]